MYLIKKKNKDIKHITFLKELKNVMGKLKKEKCLKKCIHIHEKFSLCGIPYLDLLCCNLIFQKKDSFLLQFLNTIDTELRYCIQP